MNDPSRCILPAIRGYRHDWALVPLGPTAAALKPLLPSLVVLCEAAVTEPN